MTEPSHHGTTPAAVDPWCEMAHGRLPAPLQGRQLVVVFVSPVAEELAHLAGHLGYRVRLLEPDSPRVHGPLATLSTIGSDLGDGLGDDVDVVVTDHDRAELGDVLAALLAAPTRWLGVMGSPRHTAPHVAALRERGVGEPDIARVHRPIGLDIGSHAPGEIAVSTLAGLIADRNGRSGGFRG